MGAVSTIVGIGGGSMTVPFLSWCSVGIRNAVATSAACGLPIAVAGALGFVITGWHEAGLPAGSSGFVYWPAFAGIAAASVLFAPLGARLAHSIPVFALKRFFALLLLVLGTRMLFA
ncbi:MAG: sulfite exporter TauE/SafE family protein [Candidatus Sedimenticola endophacoides]